VVPTAPRTATAEHLLRQRPYGVEGEEEEEEGGGDRPGNSQGLYTFDEILDVTQVCYCKYRLVSLFTV
jgi:hypothetical protein